ncbi:MAG: glycoside hydrolase family 31 protein [Candidatus Thermoplasmatota archaeon]|nr:glycoside hydrolase family 31 protein [Candidatus Thermoplasmatota archaeon]
MEEEKKLATYQEIFGAEIAEQALMFTKKRDVTDKLGAEQVEMSKQVPGKLISRKIKDHSIEVIYENLRLEIDIFDGPILKFTWKKCEVNTFLSLNLRPYTGGIKEDEGPPGSVRIGELVITLGDDGSIKFVDDSTGSKREDHPPEIRGEEARLISTLTESENIFGTGERAFPMNLKGNKITFWNHDANGKYGPGSDPLYLNIPVFYHLNINKGYFIFFNNPYKCIADICFEEDNKTILDFSGGGLEYYISFGPIEELIKRYTSIVGKPVLPPYWSLGYHQSRYSYKTQEEVLAVANEFVKNDLPISVIHLDIDYMDGFRVFTVDKTKFPDLKLMNQQLSEHDIRTVAIIDPGVKVDDSFEIFREGEKFGYFVNYDSGEIVQAPVWPGLSAFPDFLLPEARSWWGKKYKFFLDKGVSGFWHDMNEPATFTIHGDNTLPEHSNHSVGKHKAVHNLYANFMALAGYDGFLSLNPDERPFIISRAGWAGIQRYAWSWTGDTEGTWAELKQTISTIINLGLSGVSFTGVDIGGFSDSPSNELFLRWFQMGTFLPLFRVHSAKGTRMREPWLFGKRNLDIIRKFLKLRYRILPYIYTLSYISTINGFPLIRPLFWFGDPKTADDDEKFLLGNDILVCPILEPGQKHKDMRLPKGKWINFWNGNIEEGLVEIEVRQETVPVYVREGSVIPMKGENGIEFHIFPGSKLHGECYLDNGKLNPLYQLYVINGTWDNRTINLYVEKTGNEEKVNKLLFVIEGNIEKFIINGVVQSVDGNKIEIML